MSPERYQAFTRELVARLEAEAAILGLVATGSMAARGILPDLHSDHDFWLIATAETAESWRTDPSFLPGAEAIAFAFRETAHGVKVIFRDLHLVEYAVFAPAELELARVNRYRVLLDRGGIAARMEELRRRTLAEAAAFDEKKAAGEFLSNLLVAAGRARRGELLSAHRLVTAGALFHLLGLLARHARTDSPELRDDLDPFRRFERTHTRLATRIAAALREDPLEAARELLEIYREEVGPELAQPPAELAALVAAHLAAPRARA